MQQAPEKIEIKEHEKYREPRLLGAGSYREEETSEKVGRPGDLTILQNSGGVQY